MKKIGLLGGTFDPPHIGHLIMAEQALINEGLHEVWWMPNKIPPHKTISSDLSEEHRLELVRRMTALKPEFVLCDEELRMSGPSYTVRTVQKLQKDYPECDFYFIMGGDSLSTFHKWQDYKTLSSLLSFIVLARPGYEAPGGEYPENVTIIDDVFLELSSTYIRHAVKSGSLNRYLLTDRVYEYIKEHRLYE